MRLTDMAQAVALVAKSIHRFALKLHEALVSEDEARNTVETDEMYHPAYPPGGKASG
jgi:hypothetical protein